MGVRRASAVAILAAAALVCSFVQAGGARAGASPAHVYVVNSTGDAPDKVIDGVCQTATAGQCTLRAALMEDNADAGSTEIDFNIPGGGLQTIRPATMLPIIQDTAGPTTIDGTTQPGWAATTDPVVFNGTLSLALVGKGFSSFDGFVIKASGTVIRGVSMYNFRHEVRYTTPAANNGVLSGSVIGTDPGGTFKATTVTPGASCVQLDGGAHDIQVGLPTPADRMVVSGCPQQGVATFELFTDNNVFRNIIAGLTPLGTAALPNIANGIDINTGSANNTIGGLAPYERNVLSGNHISGNEISHNPGTVNNRVIGNLIGADPWGGAPAYAGNTGSGVRLEGIADCFNGPCTPLDAGYATVSDNVIVSNAMGGVMAEKAFHDSVITRNRIGVTASGTPAGNKIFGVRAEAGSTRITVGPGNEIAYNPTGVQVFTNGTSPTNTSSQPTDGNKVTQNSIHDNIGFGIDLTPAGQVNQGSVFSPDANDGMVIPVITSATPLSVTGTTCPGCTVEVFVADSTASTGTVGEGRTYLGSGTATNTGTFLAAIPLQPAGTLLSAVATNSAGSSSEFSRDVAVKPGSNPGPTTVVTDAFGRTVASGWGSADLGGAYTYPSGSGGLSVNGSQGLATLGAAGSRYMLLSSNAVDVDLVASVSIDTLPAGNSFGVLATEVARRTSTGDYQGRLRISPTGAVLVSASRRVSSGETQLGPEVAVGGLTAAPGTSFTLRTVIRGSSPATIQVKVWPTGTTEPSAFQVSVTDSTAGLQAGGSVGLRFYSGKVSNFPITAAFDDFQVKSG